MNRTFRLAIILISLAVIVVGIGFWSHHLIKGQNTEPDRVYKDTLIEPNTSPKNKTVKQVKAAKLDTTEQDTTPDTPVESEEDTEIMPNDIVKPADDSSIQEETVDTGALTVHSEFTDLVVENLPSEAIVALKRYDEIKLEIPKLNEKLKDIMSTKPVDFDAIGAESENIKRLNDQRKESLAILSEYSQQALATYEATLAQEREAERIIEDIEEGAEVDIEEMKARIEAARGSK